MNATVNNTANVASLTYAKPWSSGEHNRIYFDTQALVSAMGMEHDSRGPITYPGIDGFLSNARSSEYGKALASVYVDVNIGAVVQTVRERSSYGVKPVAELVAEFLNSVC